MKKFVNDPKQFVPEMLKGHRARRTRASSSTSPSSTSSCEPMRPRPPRSRLFRAPAPGTNRRTSCSSERACSMAHVLAMSSPLRRWITSSAHRSCSQSPKGILHIVNNYSGDRMAFEMATEMLDAEGVVVKTLFVDDDVAVQDSTWTVGRRGVAGNFFVIKAVGAAAEEGASLDDLIELGERVNADTRSMGMALTGCTPPAKGAADFHAGRGRDRDGRRHPRRAWPGRKKLASANEHGGRDARAILTDRKPIKGDERAEPVFKSGDEVALMVNGLGGTPISELYLIYGYAHRAAGETGHQDLAELRRRVLHLARDGGHVDHPLPGR